MITTNKTKYISHVTSAIIATPLGNVVAISDEKKLYFLQFQDSKTLNDDIKRLKIKMQSTIVEGVAAPIISIKKELKEYFCGTLKEFKTPLFLHGTIFQKEIWQALMKIPYSETKSYKELALSLRATKAYRAVGNANSKNLLVIIIPCHRIINSDGQLGGYSAGIDRKKWLLAHETNYSKKSCLDNGSYCSLDQEENNKRRKK